MVCTCPMGAGATGTGVQLRSLINQPQPTRWNEQRHGHTTDITDQAVEAHLLHLSLVLLRQLADELLQL